MGQRVLLNSFILYNRPMPLTLNDIAQNPEKFSQSFTVQNEELLLRPLLPTDVEKLTRFLQRLSEKTRRLSTFESYDSTTAQELCDAINRYDKLRFALESEKKEIVGLFEFTLEIPGGDIERYKSYGITLSSSTDCRFGPTLADDYQDKKVGSQIFPFMVMIAKQFGKQRMILFGGVLADNPRAIHFYEKNGFTRMGSFKNQDGQDCLDMMKIL